MTDNWPRRFIRLVDHEGNVRVVDCDPLKTFSLNREKRHFNAPHFSFKAASRQQLEALERAVTDWQRWRDEKPRSRYRFETGAQVRFDAIEAIWPTSVGIAIRLGSEVMNVHLPESQRMATLREFNERWEAYSRYVEWYESPIVQDLEVA